MNTPTSFTLRRISSLLFSVITICKDQKIELHITYFITLFIRDILVGAPLLGCLDSCRRNGEVDENKYSFFKQKLNKIFTRSKISGLSALPWWNLFPQSSLPNSPSHFRRIIDTALEKGEQLGVYKEKLYRVSTPGEGNCFYYAWSWFLKQSWNYHDEIRRELCQEMCKSLFTLQLSQLQKIVETEQYEKLPALNFNHLFLNEWLKVYGIDYDDEKKLRIEFAKYCIKQSKDGEFADYRIMGIVASEKYRTFLQYFRVIP